MCRPDWERPMDPNAPLPFALEAWVALAPFERTLGMTIVSAGGGEAVLTMPFTVKLAQGVGLLHGGAITALADTAAAMAIKTLLPEGTHFGTVEMTTRFLSPVRSGVVTARARAEADPARERTFVGSASVFSEDGTEAARFESVFKVARRRGDGGASRGTERP